MENDPCILTDWPMPTESEAMLLLQEYMNGIKECLAIPSKYIEYQEKYRYLMGDGNGS